MSNKHKNVSRFPVVENLSSVGKSCKKKLIKLPKEKVAKPAKEKIAKPVKEKVAKPAKEKVIKPAKEKVVKPTKEYLIKEPNANISKKEVENLKKIIDIKDKKWTNNLNKLLLQFLEFIRKRQEFLENAQKKWPYAFCGYHICEHKQKKKMEKLRQQMVQRIKKHFDLLGEIKQLLKLSE